MISLTRVTLQGSMISRARSSPEFQVTLLACVDRFLEQEPPSPRQAGGTFLFDPLLAANGIMDILSISGPTAGHVGDRVRPAPVPLKYVLGYAPRSVAILIKLMEQGRDPVTLCAVMKTLQGMATSSPSLEFAETGLLVAALKAAQSFVKVAALLPEALASRDPEVSRRPTLLLGSFNEGMDVMFKSATMWKFGAVSSRLEPQALTAMADLLEFSAKMALWRAAQSPGLASPTPDLEQYTFQQMRGSIISFALRFANMAATTLMAGTQAAMSSTTKK